MIISSGNIMYKITLLLLLAYSGFAQSDEETQLPVGKGQGFVLQSIGYPELAPAGTKKTWSIYAKDGGTLSIVCEDIRITPSDDCADGYLTIFDGADTHKYCDTYQYMTVKTYESLKLEFSLSNVEGAYKCIIKRVGDEGINEQYFYTYS